MVVSLTPLDFMRRARFLYEGRPAVVDGSHRLIYGQFGARCDRWSAALQRLGVARGDRVAYISPNTLAALESFYGVPQSGAVLVPINYRLSPEEFVYILNHSGARVVCAAEPHTGQIDAIRDELRAVKHFVSLELPRTGWLDYEALVADAPPGFERPSISESDLLTINYTSGTTARPKGVMMTHRNAWMNAVGTLVHFHMTPADRYLWTLPMFHANGWTFVWIVTAVGGTHICLRRPDPARVFELVCREGVTVLCAAPTVLISLANAPRDVRQDVPRGVRVLTAGAPPAAATIEAIEKGLGWDITQVYGLTETSPFISICEPRPEHQEGSRAERCAIKARQGVELITSGELKVIGDDGREVARDGKSLGEIVVCGNVVMEGYYNDPEATRAAMGDGWFRSGDAAVVHSDGYIEIRDRLKDVIISGGENISSVEVEAMLLRHPAVQEAGVVGLPDERWGEAPHAFIVLKAGATVSVEELREFSRARLAHFKTPHSFTFVTELPKTATGKIQKYILRGGRANLAAQ
ncbi:MAG: long-chain-fatty-acid--CoA ligase [Phycisphaerales bacterium]|nr:long-chain-fatty-acid--CoA ligase [Phycisphaerales bacterium]